MADATGTAAPGTAAPEDAGSPVDPVAPDPARRDRRRRGLLLALLLVIVGVVAYGIRVSIQLRGGGLTGLGAYDDGVYYAAADALVHGRIPYRDFLLIQPPLIAVVTAPFAALGTVIGDPQGFAIARLVYIGIGAVNAVLCGWILRRFGWSAAIVGGLGYAVFHPAVYSERSVLLEPLGTLGLLLAILLLQRAARRPWFALVAGIVGGLGVGAKIWYIVPVLLLLLMAGRRWLRYLIGVAIGGCAIYLPFFVIDPQTMFQQVVLDQIGRGGGAGPTVLHRLEDILGARTTIGIPAQLIAAVLLVIAIAAVVTTLLTRGARTLGVLAIATTVILLAAPSWFAHYTALTAPPLALCIGVATGRLSARIPARWGKVALVTLVVAGVVFTNEANDRSPYGTKMPSDLHLAGNTVKGCITADDPGVLIEMNVLSRNLRDPTCPLWPDVTGWTYDVKDLTRNAQGGLIARRLNTKWQRDIVAYMESGDATIRTRSATGYSAASKAIIDSGAVLYRNGRYVVHATHH